MKSTKSIVLIAVALLGGFLAYNSLPQEKIQEPAPMAIGRIAPPEIYPDLNITPGAVNPNVNQDTINQTICNKNWTTKSIRPSSYYTTKLKNQQLLSGYNFNGDIDPKNYEEDHLISLELGGHPSSTYNLWPESYLTKVDGVLVGARQKDTVENTLHAEVCHGAITLQRAQEIIVQDWYACWLTIRQKQPCL